MKVLILFAPNNCQKMEKDIPQSLFLGVDENFTKLYLSEENVIKAVIKF